MPQDWRKLATAVGKNGQFEQAVQATKGALRVVNDAPVVAPEVVELLNGEIAIYASGKMPYRDGEEAPRLTPPNDDVGTSVRWQYPFEK